VNVRRSVPVITIANRLCHSKRDYPGLRHYATGEERLRAQVAAGEKFRRAFNASPEPISIVTLRDGRFLDVNEAFLRVTGFCRQEVIGRTPLQLRFWTRDELRGFVKKLKKNESLRDMEISFRVKSGQERVGIHSAEIIEIDGLRCSLNIMRDMTESRLLENELTEASKTEAEQRIEESAQRRKVEQTGKSARRAAELGRRILEAMSSSFSVQRRAEEEVNP
jgi:PAS domain S-box-containing protein